MTLTKLCIFSIAALFGSATLSAQEPEAPDYGWSGKGELGFVSTSGNTETEAFKLALEFLYDSEKWRHRFAAGAFNSEDSGVTTAKRYDFGAQTDYKFNEKSYVFGALRYENDDFSAYEDQSTLTFGYGRQVLDTEKHKLKLEGGVGYRTATFAATGESQDGAVARGLLDWLWQLTPSTTLGERFLVEAGSDNTYIQNDLGLTVAINDHFALNLAYQVRHNSEVPADIDDTDTLTSANLIYNF